MAPWRLKQTWRKKVIDLKKKTTFTSHQVIFWNLELEKSIAFCQQKPVFYCKFLCVLFKHFRIFLIKLKYLIVLRKKTWLWLLSMLIVNMTLFSNCSTFYIWKANLQTIDRSLTMLYNTMVKKNDTNRPPPLKPATTSLDEPMHWYSHFIH